MFSTHVNLLLIGMNESLTARQIQILKALVDEYIETAIPVGSEALEKKYELGVSPATIRNEMSVLTKLGYLRQPHTSAGRVPSPIAMKLYINQLMEEKQMSVTEEVRAKEHVWDSRQDIHSLLREAAQALAEHTDSLAVAALDEGRVWHSGYAHVFSHPEFTNIELCSNLFNLLDEQTRIRDLFFHHMTGVSPVEVIFGEELGWGGLDPISVVATNFRIGDKTAALGVIGPARSRYSRLVPVLRYYGNLLQEVASR